MSHSYWQRGRRAIAAEREAFLQIDLLTLQSIVRKRPQSQPPAVLVYDLAPYDDRALEVVQRFKGVFPVTPILAYAPVRPFVATLLVESATAANAWPMLQLSDGDEVVRVRHAIRDLIATLPSERLGFLMQHILPHIPHYANRYIMYVIDDLAARSRSELLSDTLTVGLVSSKMGITQRTLERAWVGTTLPKPKELMDWLTLLYVAALAESTSQHNHPNAPRLGLDAQRISRMRRRLFHKDDSHAALACLNFDHILISFATRCGIPRTQTMQLSRILSKARYVH